MFEPRAPRDIVNQSSPNSMSLAEITQSDMESISSIDTDSERSEGARAGDERVNILIAAPPIEGVKHSRFFFSGDLVTFLVEGVLYRVHEYLLTTNSPFWSEKLNAQTDKAASIKLEDVTPGDLDALLTILYDTNFQEYDLKTNEDWESVLRLATRWQFEKIRGLAIAKLDSLAAPLQKLVMARAFNVPQWLQPSLVALCMRPSPLTQSEGKDISKEDLISIMSTREVVRQKTQIKPAEQDVCSYIAKHILRTEPIRVFAAPISLESRPLVPDTASTSPASPTSAPQPMFSILKPAMDMLPTTPFPLKAPDPPSISATPSAQDIQHLLAAINESDFDSALAMATPYGTKAFIDALKDFTALNKDPFFSEKLISTILLRSAQLPSFAPIGTRLLSELPSNLICNLDGYQNNTQNFLRRRDRLAKDVEQGMNRVRNQFKDFDLALRHVLVALPFGDPKPLMAILGADSSSQLTAALYDERMTNLQAFFSQISKAGLL